MFLNHSLNEFKLKDINNEKLKAQRKENSNSKYLFSQNKILQLDGDSQVFKTFLFALRQLNS